MSDLAIGSAVVEIGFGQRIAFENRPQTETAPNPPQLKPELKQSSPQVAEPPKPEPTIDEHTLAGPPPAFEISLLQLDQKLQAIQARFNAAQAFGDTIEARAPEAQDAAANREQEASRGTEAEADRQADAPSFPKAEPTAASPAEPGAAEPEPDMQAAPQEATRPAAQPPQTGLGTAAATVATPLSLGEEA